ncbi:MAG: sigma-E factor negative regulatory protein [Chromatiales bacterium]|nr:sigma-E factor negative regulatory protein [Chromatiales bacterium]
MNVSKEEFLSAMVDDEADAFTARRLAAELAGSAEERARWGRYHVIGEAMRGDLFKGMPVDFSDRVMAALDDEEPLQVPISAVRSKGMRYRPAIGIGVAASVAVAVLVGVQTMVTQAPDPVNPVVATVGSAPEVLAVDRLPPQTLAQVAVGASATEAVPSDRRLAEQRQMDARLNSYIVNHAEHASQHGLIPYVRAVGYEDGQ